MITSLPPFTTSAGWRIDFRYSNGFSPRRAPFADRLDLGGRDFLVDPGIAVLGAQPEALGELAARSLALLRLREMHAEPEMIGLAIGGAEDFLRLWRERGHALATTRAGAD